MASRLFFKVSTGTKPTNPFAANTDRNSPEFRRNCRGFCSRGLR